ncbi:Uncharacterized protein APZ42_017315 [Daphnia magna]|uniref:Uncharacterized protein n=1 Tax=Daphnia magna TaxID=35525 RepID=A0A164ZS50_9CRUS|nr:Uncharacterized protein APZ42_017315 [Daphnia magna]
MLNCTSLLRRWQHNLNVLEAVCDVNREKENVFDRFPTGFFSRHATLGYLGCTSRCPREFRIMRSTEKTGIIKGNVV